MMQDILNFEQEFNSLIENRDFVGACILSKSRIAEYPDDFEGWHCLLIAMTDNFSCPLSLSDDQKNNWFDNIYNKCLALTNDQKLKKELAKELKKWKQCIYSKDAWFKVPFWKGRFSKFSQICHSASDITRNFINEGIKNAQSLEDVDILQFYQDFAGKPFVKSDWRLDSSNVRLKDFVFLNGDIGFIRFEEKKYKIFGSWKTIYITNPFNGCDSTNIFLPGQKMFKDIKKVSNQ